MTRRSASAPMGSGSRSDVDGSVFDEKSETPAKLPTGLDKHVRKRAKAILEQNPFLKNPQVTGAVRLAKLEGIFDNMYDDIQARGLEIEDEHGDIKPNAMIGRLVQLAGAISTQEKNLAITISTRKENVDKAESAAPPKLGTRKKNVGAPRLRVA